MTKEVLKLLEEMVQRRASDLHFTSGVPPQIRIDGILVPCDTPPLTPEKCRELSYALLDEKRIARLESEKGLDTSMSGSTCTSSGGAWPRRFATFRGTSPRWKSSACR